MRIAGPAVIVAAGPSLSRADVDACSGKAFAIAINTSFRIAPWADVLYACDGSWWDKHHAEVRKTFAGELWTQDEKARDKYGLKWIRSKSLDGLCRDKAAIHQGGSSTYQAMNLAFHWGAKRILLLGVDCKSGKKDGRELKHWHGNHDGLTNPSEDAYKLWLGHFHRLAADLKACGVEVINCSPDSAIPWWPKRRIQECLPASSASSPTTGETPSSPGCALAG